MARRMISLDVVDTDAFLDMPLSAQVLYFHLNARADDDGFVANPKKIMRMLGTQVDDYKVLIIKKFVITFQDGVCVIKHWRINNFIRKDIYKETKYLNLKSTLFIRPNGSYSENDDGSGMAVPSGHFQLENVNAPLTTRQHRIGKVSIGKDRLDKVSKEIEYLSQIPKKDIDYLCERFELGENQLKSKAEDLRLYCASSGKKYKDYRAFLTNAVKRDFPKRKPPVIKEVVKPLTIEQQEKINKTKQEIADSFKV